MRAIPVLLALLVIRALQVHLSVSHTGAGMRRRNTVWLMHLIGVPDASGKPAIWINADHLVSVQPVVRTGERDVTLEAELKVDGMPLQRINLGRSR